MAKLDKIDYKIISEFVKNSRITDGKLAKKIGVSQPTVTRRRARLEKEGMLYYTAIPNFKELTFEIIAFNFGRWKLDVHTKLISKENFLKEGYDFILKHPNTIFVSSGQGLGKDSISITLHKSYADYVDYKRKAIEKWGKFLESFDSFIVSLKGDNILRQITFKHLSKYIKNQK